MGTPVSSWRSLTMATLRATPPVKVISGSIPTRRRRDRLREAIATWTPMRTSSTFRPRASQPRISDSAKTVHVVVITTGDRAWSARGPSSPGDLQGLGGRPEKPAGPGRALVVHAEVQDLARLVDADGLGVLAADVEDAAGPGEEVHGPAGVAGDLRHLRVAELDPEAAVARPDHVGHLPLPDPGVLQGLPEGRRRRLREPRPGIPERPPQDPAVVIDDDGFGLRGPDVHAGDHHPLTSPPHPCGSPAPRKRRRCGS